MDQLISAPFPPSAVSLSDGLLSTYGKYEVEQDVKKMIAFFQKAEDWLSISEAEFERHVDVLRDYEEYRPEGIRIMNTLEYLYFHGFLNYDKATGRYYMTNTFFNVLKDHICIN